MMYLTFVRHLDLWNVMNIIADRLNFFRIKQSLCIPFRMGGMLVEPGAVFSTPLLPAPHPAGTAADWLQALACGCGRFLAFYFSGASN
jgi:hypothetical protein